MVQRYARDGVRHRVAARWSAQLRVNVMSRCDVSGMTSTADASEILLALIPKIRNTLCIPSS